MGTGKRLWEGRCKRSGAVEKEGILTFVKLRGVK
jgi:hypothetical protein